MTNISDYSGDSLLVRWIREHRDYPHDDYCLIWPFGRSRNGYGTVGFDGKALGAHRLMCELIHGSAPTPEHHTAHSCGRGADGCVNPRHLSWKTNSENQLERSHWNRRTKLTPDQVDEIRALKDREQVTDTAVRYGVSETNVRQIQSGKIWRSGKRASREYTTEEVLHIRSQTGRRLRETAAIYGVSKGAIWRIQKRKSYADVPDPEQTK